MTNEELMAAFASRIVKKGIEEKAEAQDRRAEAEAVMREEKLATSEAVAAMRKKPVLTPWQESVTKAETEGVDMRNPETVVMDGEKRKDEEVGR